MVTFRLATLEDVPALRDLIPLSARQLQREHYTAAQIEGALGPVFGVDTQLIRDGTYFVAEASGQVVGCGGWSRRRTRFGGDAGRTGEDPARDPATEPAMIRAFFIHPAWARRGIGRQLLALSEQGARAAGFSQLEIAATLPGVPLYEACGYKVVERAEVPLPNGERLPIARMREASLRTASAPPCRAGC
jgi:N-acetylglutamate synthase-like GNAT family acetyltransferase